MRSAPADDALHDKWVCTDCLGDEYLRARIDSEGVQESCSYCDGGEPCIALRELADLVDTAFRKHYTRTSDQPSGFEYSMQSDRESDYEWEREGDPVEQAIGEATGVDEAIARDLQAILEGRYYDLESAKLSEETEYATDSRYEVTAPTSWKWESEWKDFEHSIRTEARFFNDRAARHLSSVFDGIEGMRTWRGAPLILEAGPGTPYPQIYRARVFQSKEKLKEALCRPDVHLGSPPSALAAAGRMNAKGVSVFYGANDSSVTIAEVRPPVGSWVAVAAFDIVRPLKLLDLTALKTVSVSGSYFDPDFSDLANRAAFLRSLSARITRPVMPDDEAFEYLATQAVADFLAARSIEIDGILFPSVQAASDDALNMVLFHKSARVQTMEFPLGTVIEAGEGYMTDEGWETDYSVTERTPDPSRPSTPEPKRRRVADLLLTDVEPLDRAFELDRRDATLSVQPQTVEVHNVGRVEFSTETFSVRRHRWEQRDSKF